MLRTPRATHLQDQPVSHAVKLQLGGGHAAVIVARTVEQWNQHCARFEWVERRAHSVVFAALAAAAAAAATVAADVIGVVEARRVAHTQRGRARRVAVVQENVRECALLSGAPVSCGLVRSAHRRGRRADRERVGRLDLVRMTTTGAARGEAKNDDARDGVVSMGFVSWSHCRIHPPVACRVRGVGRERADNADDDVCCLLRERRFGEMRLVTSTLAKRRTASVSAPLGGGGDFAPAAGSRSPAANGSNRGNVSTCEDDSD